MAVSAARDVWSSRQWPCGTPLALLFEPLCLQNGLSGGRGKERDQRACGVGVDAAGNDAGGELRVVLNLCRQRANEFDGWLSQYFADLIEADFNVAGGNARVQCSKGC